MVASTDGGAVVLGKEARWHLLEGLANGAGYLVRIRVTDTSGNTSRTYW